MPETYTVQLPDGRTISKTLPEGLSDEQIRAVFAQEAAMLAGSQVQRPDPQTMAVNALYGNLEAPEPTLASGLTDGIRNALYGLGVDEGYAGHFANKATNFLNDLTPVGDAISFDDARQAWNRGDYLAAGGNALMGVLGAIPGFGDAAAGTAKAIIAPGKGRSLVGSGAVAPDYPSPGAFHPAGSSANIPKMTERQAPRPWQEAEEFAQALRDRGLEPHVSRSQNRNGDFSAYVQTPWGDVRFSDHSANMDFRVDQIEAFSIPDIDEFVSRGRWRDAVRDELGDLNHQISRIESAERKARYGGQIEKTQANNALLRQYGFDPASMTKNQRRDALRALRRGE